MVNIYTAHYVSSKNMYSSVYCCIMVGNKQPAHEPVKPCFLVK